MKQLPVAHHKTGNVYRQISVAVAQVGYGKYEEYECEQKNGIKSIVVKIYPVDEKAHKPSQPISENSTHTKLHKQLQTRIGRIEIAFQHHIYKYYCQHIGHRVVAAALQLQHRTDVFLQAKPFGTQDGEYRCRIGGRHDRRKKHGFCQRQIYAARNRRRNEVDETSGQQSRHQHTYGGEHYTGSEHRLYLAETGVHTSRKQDYAQCHNTYELNCGRIVKLYAKPVAAEQHANGKEQQQNRHSETVSYLAEYYADKQNDRTYKQYILGCNNHTLYKITIKMFYK